MSRSIACAALIALGSLTSAPAHSPGPERIAPNDNRRAAGKLAHGVLTVALEARSGVWRPEGDSGRALDVAAFAEAGKALSTPGPVIRVPLGSEVHATIRNRLDRPLTVYGFGPDSVIIPPDSSAAVRLKPSSAGTYFYYAKRGTDPFGLRLVEDMQLHCLPREPRPALAIAS